MEYILLLLIGIIGIRTSYTDIKRRKIYNKDLMIGVVVGVIIYIAGYKQLVSIPYLINVVISVVIGLFFYGFKIWAAGDAKLYGVMILLLPYGTYRGGHNSVFPGFYVLALIFSIAFIYTLMETILLMLKKQEVLIEHKQYGRGELMSRLLDMMVGYSTILLLDQLVKWEFYLFYINNMGLMVIIHLLVLMLLYEKVRSRVVMKGLLLVTVLVNVLLGVLNTPLVGSINVLYMLMVIVVILLRVKGSQYNYEKIPTEKVLSGMILTYGTVIKFLPSRVKGLPRYTDETTKCRITEEEAEAIKRWQHSKYGEDFIMVVKHIPFAPFIFIGTLLYLIMNLV